MSGKQHQREVSVPEQYTVEAMIRGKWRVLYIFGDFNGAVGQAEALRMVKANTAVRVTRISKIVVFVKDCF